MNWEDWFVLEQGQQAPELQTALLLKRGEGRHCMHLPLGRLDHDLSGKARSSKVFTCGV